MDQGEKISINTELLGKMADNEAKLIEFTENAKAMEKMINKHHDEVIEQERTKKKEVRKHLAIKTIKTAAYIAAGISLAALANKAAENVQGKNEIVKEFSDATREFGIMEYSSGYRISEQDHYIDLVTGAKRMAKAAEAKGMSDEEIAIGLTANMNKEITIKVLGEKAYPSFVRRCKIYQDTYHKMKDNNEKSSSKGTGK